MKKKIKKKIKKEEKFRLMYVGTLWMDITDGGCLPQARTTLHKQKRGRTSRTRGMGEMGTEMSKKNKNPPK